MEKGSSPLANTCSFTGIKPFMTDLPYPPIQVGGKNEAYANLLSIDYCGSVSELSAITQYINNENRISCENCSLAKTFLGIAVAEMMHLQKLGEMIVLLGGNVGFTAKYRNGSRKMWTPGYLTLPEDTGNMIRANIEAEKAAIEQYAMHIKMIRDEDVDAVLERIIQDEEYHIMLLKALL
ncbi:MAG: rubrerythrin family protein [Dorea sp.]|jgi:bacterioferritin|nr:rubrerythrin family protein [Dorea sp.]